MRGRSGETASGVDCACVCCLLLQREWSCARCGGSQWSEPKQKNRRNRRRASWRGRTTVEDTTMQLRDEFVCKHLSGGLYRGYRGSLAAIELDSGRQSARCECPRVPRRCCAVCCCSVVRVMSASPLFLRRHPRTRAWGSSTAAAADESEAAEEEGRRAGVAQQCFGFLWHSR